MNQEMTQDEKRGSVAASGPGGQAGPVGPEKGTGKKGRPGWLRDAPVFGAGGPVNIPRVHAKCHFGRYGNVVPR
jgi:hypothetical protein